MKELNIDSVENVTGGFFFRRAGLGDGSSRSSFGTAAIKARNPKQGKRFICHVGVTGAVVALNVVTGGVAAGPIAVGVSGAVAFCP